MTQSQAQRRLVKPPPELWAQVSTRTRSRRLARFGEIRITRFEPETTVAWEGDRASGTVELEPAGRGRRPARVTATPDPSPPAPGPEPPPPDPDPAPTPAQRAVATGSGDARLDDARTTEMPDDLGAAHHRPFSRD